jgi:hypothetical protein
MPLLTSPTVRFASDRVWSMSVDGKSPLEPFPTVWRVWGGCISKWQAPISRNSHSPALPAKSKETDRFGTLENPFVRDCERPGCQGGWFHVIQTLCTQGPCPEFRRNHCL